MKRLNERLRIGAYSRNLHLHARAVNEITQKFSEDTFQNINYLVRTIFEDIAEKELEVYKQVKEQ